MDMDTLGYFIFMDEKEKKQNEQEEEDSDNGNDQRRKHALRESFSIISFRSFRAAFRSPLWLFGSDK